MLRTFLRILFTSLFTKNPVADIFVNFCNKNSKKNIKTIKFDSKLPIMEIERKNFFQSVTGDRIDCKW